LTRSPKNHSDDVKLSIYRRLNGRGCRFNELSKASGRDKVTLSEYLRHGQEVGELERNPKTREYHLTALGQDTLQRIVMMQEIKAQPVALTGPVDSTLPALTVDDRYLLKARPLPMSVEVTMFGTEETRGFMPSLVLDVLEVQNIVKPSRVPRLKLHAETTEVVEKFVWDEVWKRYRELLSLQVDYREYPEIRERMGKPPPLTAQNVLGFDRSLAIRYEGRKLMESDDVRKQMLAGKRLGAMFLLRLASGDKEERSRWFPRYSEVQKRYTETDVPQLHEASDIAVVIRLLQEGGVFGQEDAQKLLTMLPDGATGEWIPSEECRKVILEMALRYLNEGGMVKKDFLSWLTDKGRELEKRTGEPHGTGQVA
jgi:DNA-binding HxlR family transcriptional regulator